MASIVPSMEKRKDKRGRLVCYCKSYHFPHRKGGGACEWSSRADYYLALRGGMSFEEATELLSVYDLRKMFPVDGDRH